MKLASFQWGGKRHVGIVSADGSELTPLACDASRGLLALIEQLSSGAAMPQASGTRLPLAAVQLDAPLPRQRRNLFCVGRNYRSHAKELAASVFKDSGKQEDGWPMVFMKLPDCVVAPGADVEMPRAGSALVSEQIDYEAELA
jgi:2-keto-4-pentenoate hydratase/2-oxohepta-3-ene-1,7-dioic acid hydratase in catechol pathway